VVPDFKSVAGGYAQAWGIGVLLTDPNGEVLAGAVPCSGEADHCRSIRAQAIAESARWGEPHIVLCPRGMMVWAIPVMHNARILGGLVAGVPDPGLAPDPLSETSRINAAAEDLMQRAVAADLTNGSYLELQRQAARRESGRAEALHTLKDTNLRSIRELYLLEEPAMIAAVKRGDRPAARAIVNRVLTGIYYVGRNRPELLKSFLLELVVVMSRSAVEAGADPGELLGANYSSFSTLAGIDGEEELTAWLVGMLEQAMDAIVTHHRYPIGVLLSDAIRYMEEHVGEGLSRDDVAARACLSPAHFSRVVKQTYGYSFTELLARMRVDRACELLTVTERPLSSIAADCGFADQSYFTKVFQRHVGQTPGEYRRARLGERPVRPGA